MYSESCRKISKTPPQVLFAPLQFDRDDGSKNKTIAQQSKSLYEAFLVSTEQKWLFFARSAHEFSRFESKIKWSHIKEMHP